MKKLFRLFGLGLMVSLLVASCGGGGGGSSPPPSATANGYLFFAANNGTNGFELWKTDGSASGTVMVKNINTTASTVSGVDNSSNPGNFFPFNGNVYFYATNDAGNTVLYKSDGSAAGTISLKNSGGDELSNPALFTIYHNELYFSAAALNGGAPVVYLWKTDGTAAGTVRVTEESNTPNALLVFNDLLIVVTGTGIDTLSESSGSYTLNSVSFGGGSALSISSDSYVIFNNTLDTALYFVADGGDGKGVEIWKTSDASTAVRVTDINTNAGDSNPSDLTVFNGNIYFSAFNGTTYDLWKTNGVPLVNNSPGSQIQVTNIAASQAMSDLTVINGVLYFVATDATFGTELRRYDSTYGVGTYNLNSGSASSVPTGFIAHRDVLFFAATGPNGRELYYVDPAEAFNSSQAYIFNLNTDPEPSDSNPTPLGILNGTLFFAAYTPDKGAELWHLTLTATGPSLLKDICSGTCSGLNTVAP